MTDPSPPEPSMEDILASIRQIISDDLASPAPAESEAAPDDHDVLLLTERAAPEASPFAPSAAPPPAAPPPAAQPPVVQGREVALAPAGQNAVVTHETAASVAASFERLNFVVQNPPPPPPPFTVSAGGATLEDITKELLKPVITAWLDANLPAIVRARVDEEVERIVRARVR